MVTRRHAVRRGGGQSPFRGGSTVTAITAVLTAEVVPPQVAGPLREAVLGMLVRNAEQRLSEQSVRALLQEAVEGVSRRTLSGQAQRQTATRPLPAAPVVAGKLPAAAGRPPRGPARSALIAGLAALVLVPLGILAAGQLGGEDTSQDVAQGGTTSPASTPSGPLAPPDPFQSRELFEFGRGLFDPEGCVRPGPGEFPVLEENPDVEAVVCQGSTYAGKLFRKASVAELADERALYIDKALPGSVSPLAGAPAGAGEDFDGRAFAFVPRDERARVYWDSRSCLCGGVIEAPDGDTEATVDYWRQG